MNTREFAEFAEDHGYQHRRCHACGAHWWTDTNEPCPKCGGARQGDEEKEEAQ